jgi:ABC-type multidrug transport system fused ATPase/permease subunit
LIQQAYAGLIGYRLSQRLHSKMTYKLFHSDPQKFLSRVPQGVIVNRFSGDLKTIDKQVYEHFPKAVSLLSDFIVNIVVIFYALSKIIFYSLSLENRHPDTHLHLRSNQDSKTILTCQKRLQPNDRRREDSSTDNLTRHSFRLAPLEEYS